MQAQNTTPTTPAEHRSQALNKIEKQLSRMPLGPISIDGLKITTMLMTHQREGVSRMIQMERDADLNGIILADEMGLGKTLQCLALIAFMNYELGPASSRTLILAPPSAIPVWRAQIEEHLDEEDFRVLYCHPSVGGLAPKDVPRDTLRRADIVVAGTDHLTHELKMYKDWKEKKDASEEGVEVPEFNATLLKTGRKFPFHRVIVDEVHKAGNRANELAEALRILHPRKLVLMTGTPILNDACAELSSYFEIMKIHPWADQSILHDAFFLEDRAPDLRRQSLARLLQLHMIRRRTQDNRFDLPRVTINHVAHPMGIATRKLVESMVVDTDIDDTVSEENSPNLLKQRLAICHPALVEVLDAEEKGDDEVTWENLRSQLQQDWVSSERLARAFRCYKEYHEKHEGYSQPSRTVIFSEWTQLLDLMGIEIEHRTGSTAVYRIDDNIPLNDRWEVVTKFRQSPSGSVMLATFRAEWQSTSRAADHFIILARTLTPMIELRAITRIHRKDHMEDVTVDVLKCPDATIENKVDEIRKVKSRFYEDILEASGKRTPGDVAVDVLDGRFSMIWPLFVPPGDMRALQRYAPGLEDLASSVI